MDSDSCYGAIIYSSEENSPLPEPIHLDSIDVIVMKALLCMQTYIVLFPLLYCWLFGCPCSGHNTTEMEFERKNKDEVIEKRRNAIKTTEILHRQQLRAKIWKEEKAKSNNTVS